jgi:hypothetical protein
MKITKQQAAMLADLASTIQEEYGYLLGYTNPNVPMPMQREVDFIIYENEEILKCIYKDDVTTQPMGPYLCRVISEFPEHDDKVQDLFDRLNQDLMDGKIGFDPGVTRTEGDVTVSVTKKNFPGMDEDMFDTNIMSNVGTIYPYRFISARAEKDKKFALAKKIIDDMWPQPGQESEQSTQKKPNLLDLFKKWFF